MYCERFSSLMHTKSQFHSPCFQNQCHCNRSFLWGIIAKNGVLYWHVLVSWLNWYFKSGDHCQILWSRILYMIVNEYDDICVSSKSGGIYIQYKYLIKTTLWWTLCCASLLANMWNRDIFIPFNHEDQHQMNITNI